MRITENFAINHSGRGHPHSIILILILFVASLVFFPISVNAQSNSASADRIRQTISTLASFGDRATGTKGNKASATYIKKMLSEIGLEQVGSIPFEVPVLKHNGSTLTLPDRNVSIPISPIRANAISPGTIPAEGMEGPLVYVGPGDLNDLNGKSIDGAIILMEFDSGKNWLHVASLGAKALIYVSRNAIPKTFFEEKLELTPIRFSRFWMPYTKLKEMFGNFESAPKGVVSSHIRLVSEMIWENAEGENIYGLIEGMNPDLNEELIMIEAFYDSTAWIPGQSPGADEACGIATLLEIARILKQVSPGRSILIVATDGHAHALAGMRELIWSLSERSKNIRKTKKRLRNAQKSSKQTVNLLKRIFTEAGWLEQSKDPAIGVQMKDALLEQIKTEVDIISRRLMHLRMQEGNEKTGKAIDALSERRLVLRRLVWQTSFAELAEAERKAVLELVPLALKNQNAILSDAKTQSKNLKAATKFRSLVKSRELAAVISLHLSSHGDGFGAFNRGWMYPLKPTIDRVNAYSTLDGVLRHSGALVENTFNLSGIFKDTLRPSRRHPWQSYFLDRPHLGGEVSSLAGYVGITFATVNDARQFWGTPYDTPETVNYEYAEKQGKFIAALMQRLSDAEMLHSGVMPRPGFGAVTGRASFLRHGELFADQPAPGSMILAYQHQTRHYSMVDAMGYFMIKGVAWKKHVLHKVILEGYRYDPVTGETVWAIDKNKTGKSGYRVKMNRRFMETDLIMFAGKQTTLFNLLEPRSFRYMTKVNLIDGRREAPPLRRWYSRIDTKKSIILSTFLESGTRLKMTLSDSVFKKKLILINATEDNPQGFGYLVDDWPFIHRTEYMVAKDMWTLLKPRIVNLESRGIYNDRIRGLQKAGSDALRKAETSLNRKQYDRFFESAKRSWALASRVYDHVQKTQKDVLFGVLFYIALFVPFAFCMERLLFCYANIYKRLIAFSVILLVLVAVIYRVHPAFQLAYSPMVVILAFFIMGLSLLVTLIIFFRFEEEMILLQRRAKHLGAEEIGRWKAFVASFLLGVSNLRRRRLRTGLTCATLIILTFTIMSFTSVKTMRRHARIQYQPEATYQGFLLKNANWKSLPSEALGVFSNAFEEQGLVAPRVWLEYDDKTQATRIPVRSKGRVFGAQGLVGLSAQEGRVTGLERIIEGGRWFNDTERHAVLLSKLLAKHFGIDPQNPEGNTVTLWGIPFTVVGTFSEQKLQAFKDLDGETLTPVIFPSEISMEITDVEVEAMESGEDIVAFQSRYQHIPADQTLIIPYQTLMAAGGELKAVAVRPQNEIDTQKAAQKLVDRFGLALFSGEKNGTFLYNASDTMSYSGVPNIAIPLVISIFIVLNTMIGSVYERKREIGIYTSVGLAPSHVSFLFIAEALAFAVISVVLGYLLAQTTASIFAGTSLWSGITVNYSSLAGVAAMVLVILVVLVSVIYPSKVAAQIAIPDVNRSWKLPAARNNAIEVTLPFLMKYHEHKSIGGFIYDYLQGHQDVSHGIFSTGDIDLAFVCPLTPVTHEHDVPCNDGSCCSDACLNLHSKVWLAPFDFGIMQDVEVQFCPAEEESGFLEIKIRLTRESGEANAWRRINKAFLHSIRKQLLVWRSLDDESHIHYERRLMSAEDNTRPARSE